MIFTFGLVLFAVAAILEIKTGLHKPDFIKFIIYCWGSIGLLAIFLSICIFCWRHLP